MRDPQTPIGVLVMAYGTASGPDDIERYYTDIRRGRPPTDEQLADLTRRYDAIGGLSPLLERTEAQRRAVQAALEQLAPVQYTVVLGLKHSDPTIEARYDAAGLRQLLRDANMDEIKRRDAKGHRLALEAHLQTVRNGVIDLSDAITARYLSHSTPSRLRSV